MKPEPHSPARSGSLLKCLRALLAASGGMIVSMGSPAQATVTTPLPEGEGSLEDRVQKIQDQLRQNTEGVENGTASEEAPKTMWWNNWHNWHNWHNWGNGGWGNGGWHNWGNGGWHNWGNWHNF